MSRGVNKAILIGNCTADPETRTLPAGGSVTNVRLAMNETYKKKDGSQAENTEYMTLVFFKRLAEIAGEYLKKGSKIYVEGQLRTRQWERDGQKHWTTEIVVREMQMLDSRGTGQGSQDNAGGNASPPPLGSQPDFDDDIPF